MRTLLTVVLMAGAAASPALCDGGDFQWQGRLAPGQLIEIRGISGAIHAQGTSGNIAMITAHKIGGSSDPASVTIHAVPYDGGVVVCAVYPDSDSRPMNTCNPPGMDTYLNASDNDVQVEFTVSVPQGVLFSGVTLKGDIDAGALTADVDAAALNGNVSISTTGGGRASTLNGSITAVIGSVKWAGIRYFDAGHGNLDLQIPSDANVTVQASAFEGSITSDFPLTIMPTGNSSMARGTLGTGGRSLRLSAFGGNITLRQGPPSGK